MDDERRVPTALGQPITLGKDRRLQVGQPPVILQVQSFGYIQLEGDEQLRQWEQDMRSYYGIEVDASNLRGVACETCSAGCTDDCGMLA